ncbi:protein kinase domain-containing protein [Streptomyces halobius]|uniref:PQQ-binding-like beta-propeller repeat protein n=1 Tax=Streptomyces halobius TaxID=2879846 RepID=A0ABY4M856_9ACTN|nr:serine/threonine-protein kinase [Streptomyces halobius]UQA93900.1 PQQ-binding-like beta-propeller repeat protein [Streptomyces halobius]
MPSLRDPGAGPEAERPDYAGQYRLETRLGSGGMGVVHLARSSSGLLLAVKVIHAEFAQDPEFRGRFRQEVAAARRVSGTFTAPVVDADPDAERPWMATLHIAGPPLSEHVKRNGPLPPAEVRRLASGLAEALRDIHRAGVVHRDLKPGNVLLATDGPKVIDFGISRPNDSEMRTETGKLIGTPPFMAPEQFQRPREVGPAADVFALGSVLVHAATGSGPFDSESPYLVAYQVVHDDADLAGVPEELAPLIESCLAKHPEDRPTPDALMKLLQTDVPTAAQHPLPQVLQQWPGADGVDAPGSGESGGEDGAGAVSGAGDGSGSGDGSGPGSRPSPVSGTRIPGQRRPVGPESTPIRTQPTPIRTQPTPIRAEPTPVRAEPAPSRAGATHVRVVTPRSAGPDTPAPPASGPRRRPRRPRRRPVWAAVALVLSGAGAFVGVRALSSGEAEGDPALQTRPSRAAAGDFRPWRTTLLERPDGHAAEMPFCTTGDGTHTGGTTGTPTGNTKTSRTDAPSTRSALFCVQSGIRAARVDPDTGRVVWRRPAGPATKSAAPPTAPVLSGGLLYVFSPDGKRLEALDPSIGGKGATRWTKDLSGYEGGATIVGDRVLLASGDGTVTALDSATHQQRWRKRYPQHKRASFKSYGDARTAYAVGGSVDGPDTPVTAIDPKDGEVRWTRRLPGSLTLAGTGTSGALYFTVADPMSSFTTTAVLRYDPDTGRTRRIPPATPLDGVLAVVREETVYLLAEGGGLHAVGERKWDLETSVSRASAPVVAGDRLYVTAADGRLLAVDTRSGTLLGQTRARLAADRHNGFLETLPAPLVDGPRGRIYAAAPDGTVFVAETKDPAHW